MPAEQQELGGGVGAKGRVATKIVEPLTPAGMRDLEIFVGLDDAQLAEILALATSRHILRGASVFTQGEPAQHFFVLAQGRLKVLQVSQAGQQVVSVLVSPGEPFGMAHMLGRSEYPGTVVAVTDSVVLAWPVAAWTVLQAQHQRFSEAAMRAMGKRMQEMMTRLHEVASERVEQRIAHVLLRFVRQCGRRTEGGVLIDFPLTREDIAGMASTTLHTVSRTLAGWVHAGVLGGGRRTILVRDARALMHVATGAAE